MQVYVLASAHLPLVARVIVLCNNYGYRLWVRHFIRLVDEVVVRGLSMPCPVGGSDWSECQVEG